MSELHKFIFEGLPVRGILVRLTGAWTGILQRRASNTQTGAYPAPVQHLLGELLAAATLMQYLRPGTGQTHKDAAYRQAFENELAQF